MDDYYAKYDDEPNFLEGAAYRLYQACGRVTGGLASTASSLLMLPYTGVCGLLQWFFFSSFVHLAEDNLWSLCDRNGCRGLALVLTTLMLSCVVFGIILYVIVLKKNKRPVSEKPRSEMVTTSTQVEDLTHNIDTTRHMSDSRLDSLTDDNTSRNVHIINSSCDGDRGDRLLSDRIIGDRVHVTKAYRRTISFSEDVDIRPANKKRRLPVTSKTDMLSPRKPTSLSASSVSLSVRNKQSSTALYPKRRSDEHSKCQIRSSSSKVLSSDRSGERQNSPVVLLGARKSRTGLKSNKSNSTIRTQSLNSRSGSFIQSDQNQQKQSTVKLQSKSSSKRLKTPTRNKPAHVRNLNTTRAEGTFTNKRVLETNSKVLRKRSVKEKHRKYNEDAYLIDHDRPRGTGGCQAVFSTSRPGYSSGLVRPHATREHDYHSHHADVLPPRKTDTPEIKSFKGQGAFTPMFKERIENNFSWCNNTTRPFTQSFSNTAKKMLKNDKLLFRPGAATKPLPRLSNPPMFAPPGDTNVNSLRGLWLHPAVLQNRTDNSAAYLPGQRDLTTVVTAGQNDAGGGGGVRKENLNFMLSSKPRSHSRRRTGVKINGVKGDHLSSSSSGKSRSSRGSQRHLSNTSIRHALENGLVKTRHPLKPLLKPQVTVQPSSVKAQGLRTFDHVSSSTRVSRDLSAGPDVQSRDVEMPRHDKAHRCHKHSPPGDIPALYSHDMMERDVKARASNTARCHRKARDKMAACGSVCRCAEGQADSDVTSSSTDDSRVETCRFCQKVARPLTSHRHKPYDAVTSRSLRHRKWPRLDRNNHSPHRRQAHFYLVDDDVTSVDSDFPPEMTPRLHPGTDSRHVISQHVTAAPPHVILPARFILPGMATTVQKTKKRPKFKVNKYVAPENSCFQAFKPTKLGTDQDNTKNVDETKDFEKTKDPEKINGQVSKSPIEVSLSPRSYIDYLTYCRAMKNTVDESKFLHDEDKLRLTKASIKGGSSTYAKYLRHCYEEELSSKTEIFAVDDTSKVPDSNSQKNVEVQTSPNLESSKSWSCKNKSSHSRPCVPKLLCNKFYRQNRMRRAYQMTRIRSRKLQDKVVLREQKKNESKTITNGYLIKHSLEHETEEVHIATVNDSDNCSENEFHEQQDQQDSVKSNRKLYQTPTNEPGVIDNQLNEAISEEKYSCADNQSESEEDASTLNKTYTIENQDEPYARPAVSYTIINEEENFTKRSTSPDIEYKEQSVKPIASPRKNLSPLLASRFMQRPMWQNADVNELDRRVKRALRLREELQLRKQNKNSTQTTMHLIQQVEQGFKSAEAAETCTEDLRPSDTDEIPSCQLDTTLNMDGIVSIGNDDNPNIKEKTFRSENNSSTSTNTDTVVVNNVSIIEEPWLTQESCDDLIEHALYGNVSQHADSAPGDVTSLLKIKDRTEQIAENEADSVDLAGAACLDTLTDDLHKIQKRQDYRSSAQTSSASVYTASTQLSTSSVHTESTKTDKEIAARQSNKKNTPPEKLPKSDTGASQNGLRLIGELVESLPKVPTQSMVDWFLATSDPRDCERISKSDFSSNSSDYGIYRGVNATKVTKNSSSKMRPLPKSRLKSPCVEVTNDGASYITPPQSFTRPEAPQSNHVDIAHISGGRIKYHGNMAIRREPSKRFHKVKERKTTPARPKRCIAKIEEAENTAHVIPKPSVESDAAYYNDRRLNENKPKHSFFQKNKEDIIEQTPRSRARGSSGRSLSRLRAAEPRPTRALSQPPSLPTESPEGFPGEENFPAGIQQIIKKLRERSAPTSPTDSQPDKFRITIKKKSDIRGIIAKFSKR